MGLAKVPEIPDVPLVMDLATDAEQRDILQLLLAAQAMAWPVFAAAEVPPERVELLRRAYLAMLKDPEALADAHKVGIEIDPVPGTAINDMLGRVYVAAPPVSAKARELAGRK